MAKNIGVGVFACLGLLIPFTVQSEVFIVNYEGEVSYAYALGDTTVPSGIGAGDRVGAELRFDTEGMVVSGAGSVTTSYADFDTDVAITIEGSRFELTRALIIQIRNDVDLVIDGVLTTADSVAIIAASETGDVFPNRLSRSGQNNVFITAVPPDMIDNNSLIKRNEDLDLSNVTSMFGRLGSSGYTTTNSSWTIGYSVYPASFQLCQESDLVCQSKALRWANYYRGLLKRGALYYGGFQGTWITCVSLWTCAPLYAAGVLSVYEIKLLVDIYNDPPDTNYWEVVRPEKMPPIQLVAPVPEAEEPYEIANAYFDTYADYLSVLVAWRITLERYQGAMADGAFAQAEMQGQALARFINKAVELASDLSIIGIDFADAFESLNGNVEVPQEAFDTAVANFNIASLDQTVLGYMFELGMTAADVEVALSQMREANFEQGPYDFFGEIRSASDDVAPLINRYRCLGSACEVKTVGLDIKAGTNPNDINPQGKQRIPVTVLTTESFDATQVNWETVFFGPDEATEYHERAHIEDVDLDGDMDIVLHFNTPDTGIACGDTEATLTGETFDAQAISGTDSIVTVNCD
jgi:hypothetical protein